LKVQYDEPPSSFAYNLNVRRYSTALRGGVSRPNGDFLLSGQLGAPGVLGSDISFVRQDLTAAAAGCADDPALAGKFNESAGAACMSQVLTLAGAGCVAGDPSAACGAPKAVSFLGAGNKGAAAGDMAGRCKLTVSKPVLKAPIASALETII
jgi:hypothetical protein